MSSGRTTAQPLFRIVLENMLLPHSCVLLKIIMLSEVTYINNYFSSLVALENGMLAVEPGSDYAVHTGLKLTAPPKPHKCTMSSLIMVLFSLLK